MPLAYVRQVMRRFPPVAGFGWTEKPLDNKPAQRNFAQLQIGMNDPRVFPKVREGMQYGVGRECDCREEALEPLLSTDAIAQQETRPLTVALLRHYG